MYFQNVLKGVSGIDDQEAYRVLTESGIVCNWWRRVGLISPYEIRQQLTERNLLWHLNRYDETDPATGAPFCENTPFTSTTAGAIERDVFLRRNVVHAPLLTALRFATDNFAQDGHIFWAYVYTLGRKSLLLEEFAEEVRELHIYTSYLPYQLEGEIVAKIQIPVVRLQRVERYSARDTFRELMAGRPPVPAWSAANPYYSPPEEYSNIRGYL